MRTATTTTMHLDDANEVCVAFVADADDADGLMMSREDWEAAGSPTSVSVTITTDPDEPFYEVQWAAEEGT